MQDEKYQDIWDSICNQVKSYEGVNAAQTDAFFSRLHLQAFAEGFIMLTADNSFIKKWIERQYSTLINRALEDIYHAEFTVVIEVDELDAVKTLNEAHAASAAAPAPSAPVVPVQPTTPQLEPAPQPVAASRPEPVVNPPSEAARKQNSTFSKMTFENYIIGESNRMAYSMALAVAEHPGQEHLNPLFIYGKSGVGKTHLLVSIKNYLDRSTDAGGHPLLKTVYVDSTEFINDYADASADHSREKESFKRFKERYEEADVLLIDDVQSFQGKKETLKIVFELFNKLTSQPLVKSGYAAPVGICRSDNYNLHICKYTTY